MNKNTYYSFGASIDVQIQVVLKADTPLSLGFWIVVWVRVGQKPPLSDALGGALMPSTKRRAWAKDSGASDFKSAVRRNLEGKGRGRIGKRRNQAKVRFPVPDSA